MKIFYIAQWRNSIYDGLFNHLNLMGVKIKALVAKKYSSIKQINNAIYSIEDCIDYTLPIGNKIHIIDFKNIKDLVLRFKPDIIVSNLFYQVSTIRAMNVANKLKIPFILQTEIKCYPKNMFFRFLLKSFLSLFFLFYKRRIYKVISWTEDSKLFLENEFGLDNVNFNLPGIDIHKFYNQGLSKEKNNLKLLMVARFYPYKRHIDLLRSLKYLIEEKSFVSFELTLIGIGGFTHNMVKRYIKLNNLSNFVRFIPSVNPDEMVNIFNEHDVLILPSYNEAIGLVVPEAMLCGLPVIVSDTVGARSYLGNECGLIFKTGDHKQLAEKILLFCDEEVRSKYGKNAESHIRGNFSLEKQANKFKRLIKF